MKSFTNPPVKVKEVGDLMCILLAVKPSLDSFRKILANPNEFLNNLIHYDKDNVSKNIID